MPSNSGIINYRESFKIPVLTKLQGEPTVDLLILLKRELKANVSSVYSNLGGGTHGHLFLVISPTQFNLLLNAAFIRPIHPGPLTIPNSITAAMSVVIEDQYNVQLRLFREVNGVEKAMISQILSAINAEFFTVIINCATNAIPGLVHLVLDYLNDTYGKVTPQLLDKKETILSTTNYTPASPIETIFTAVEDLAEYAELNSATMTHQHTI